MLQGLVDKIQPNLAQWKSCFLRKARRLVVIKSTLAAILVFMLSLFVIPCSVAEEIERIIKNFFGGLTLEKKKVHLIPWEHICTDVDWGGLGIKSVGYVNVSLLCKWLWLIGYGDDRLWKRIIFDKYGKKEGGWCTKQYAKP